jgi:hypothetical protein
MTLVNIDKDVFRDFTRRHPALLFPAFELQRVFQKHCLGEAFWKRLTQQRIDISYGKFLSVGQIIEMLSRPLARKLSRNGVLETVNLEKMIVAQHGGSIRRIATADREDNEQTANSQSLNLMANTITMASHSKRRASATKVVPVVPTEPIVDASHPSQGDIPRLSFLIRFSCQKDQPEADLSARPSEWRDHNSLAPRGEEEE